ncbi:hypothetical protein GWK47_045497 [Chionoecetes opilio]|uniref:Uncharacterized protein n=1 Tax=Chionoecetes opilio TaxID=41210 RepID=A0A8J5CWU3_CHIOP|nr:hypothetical protein GWK47_045497 [Chionoecetes opilio]
MAVRCKHHPPPAAALHCKTSDISGLPLHLGYLARQRPPCHHHGSLPLRLLPAPMEKTNNPHLRCRPHPPATRPHKTHSTPAPPVPLTRSGLPLVQVAWISPP